MILTLKQLQGLGAEPVSYLSSNGGIGFGYRLPKSFWKTGEAEFTIFINRGNGHHAEIVEKVWIGETKYLETLKAL